VTTIPLRRGDYLRSLRNWERRSHCGSPSRCLGSYSPADEDAVAVTRAVVFGRGLGGFPVLVDGEAAGTMAELERDNDLDADTLAALWALEPGESARAGMVLVTRRPE